MSCYNSPTYNYYNNGPWENSTGCDNQPCGSRQEGFCGQGPRQEGFCGQGPRQEGKCNRLTYIFNSIIGVETFPGGSAWTGCISVSLLPDNIKIKYLDTGTIGKSTIDVQNAYSIPTISNGSGHTYTQFDCINQISYTSYECNTLSDVTLDIDLSNLETTATATDSETITISYIPSNVKIQLPINMSEVEQRLTLNQSGGTITTDSICDIGTISDTKLIVTYCYNGFCNNISLNILSMTIVIGNPIPVHSSGCY